MAISLSKLKRQQTKRSIADELTAQASELQEVPWWETVGNIALPILATAAMGPLGGYLSPLGGGAGILGALGTGLSSVGAVGSGLGGVGKTLGSTAVKALYNMGVQEAKKGLYKGLDKRSEKDIKVSGDSFRKLLGKSAEGKLRGNWLDAQSAMDRTNVTGAVLGAAMSQGSGAFKDMFKDLFKGKGSSMLEGLSEAGVDEAQQMAKTADIMGGQIIDPKTGEAIRGQVGQASPLQKIASGQRMIADPSLDMTKAIDAKKAANIALQKPSGVQNLLNQQMGDLTSQYDFGGSLLKDASSRQGTIANNLLALQNLEDTTKAMELFLPGQGSTPSNLTPEAIQQLLNSYYGYEDIPKGWK